VLKRVYNATSCPACGSETHFIEGKYWQCADCKNEWRPPRGLRNSKALVSVRRLES
jgi:ribosomal protein L37AE/L43A